MNLTVFQYSNKEVRTIVIDNEPWFVAKDVLAVMESKTTVTALKALVSEDLGDEFVSNQPILDSLNREQTALCLSEAALTFFVSRSRTEMGKAINRWIHSEVLPSIRKTGNYAIAAHPQLPTTYIEALKALVALEEAKAIADAERALLEEQNQQLSEAVDELFDYSSVVRIAKFNGVSEKLFKWQTLKAVSKKMDVEIKRVPCPRFEYKNLYSHDVWRVCYPTMRLPETTTLIVRGGADA